MTTNQSRKVSLAWAWPLALCLLATFGASGCRDVKIPNGHLLCSPQKTCPSPYQCVADHCWSPGTGPADGGTDGPAPDASKSDAKATNDGKSPDVPSDTRQEGDGGTGPAEQGAACTADGQCMTGHCVDQVCCDKPCDGLCVSCAGVFTGGLDGTCAPALAGMNSHPARDCLTSTAEPCGNDGTCDGAGACRLQGSTQSCAASACSGAVGAQSYQPTASCDGTGKCVSPAKQSCGQYDCSPTNGCAKPCTADMNCGDGNFCGSDSVCRTKKIDGAACTAANECSHGFCVDGFCCESDCTKKSCFSCARTNTGQADGKCAPVTRGKASPRATDCKAAADPKTCGLDGLCDGAGACESYGNTTTCADASCSGSKFTAAATCNGMGKCGVGATMDCGSFQCAVTGCKTKCTQDAECSGSSYCAADGTCAAKTTNGTACTAAKQCASNACVDGVCCETSCGQTCYGCSLEKTGKANGTCAPLKSGTSRTATECPAAAMSTCGNDGTCDGAGKCRAWASGTTCAAGSCGTTGFTGPKSCDGAGHCAGPAAVACGAYPCDAASGCAVTCSASVPCAGDTYCDSGTSKCVAKKANGQTCGSANECVSKTCVDGVCCNSGCTGACMSCRNADTGMGEGTCAAIKSGTKSTADCPTDTTACGRDGTCNGAGACTYKASGTSCGSAMCTGSTLQAAPTCDGKGTCNPGSSSTCNFGCQSSTPACATSCPGGQKICNNGCISNLACCGGCTGGKQCVSGSCVCPQKSSTNLLDNPGFDGGASSWLLFNAATNSWGPADPSNTFTTYNGANDAANCTGSGSMSVSSLVGAFSQCQFVGFGAVRYYFGFLFKGTGYGACSLDFFGDTGCTMPLTTTTSGYVANDPAGSAWGAATSHADATADVNSIRISCSAPGGSGYYDDLYVTTSSSNGY